MSPDPQSGLAKYIKQLEIQNLYRRRKTVSSPQGRELVVDGMTMLNFCSNDYLGLANDQRVRDAFKRGVDRWGVGSGASHLVSGHTSAHHELEEALASFTGRPRALLFSSGYTANIGVINGLLNDGDNVFEDRLNHASLLDGGWLSRANFNWFPHKDYEALMRQLKTTEDVDSSTKTLVVSDGTFSMDGDQANVAELVKVTKANNALLMIDDAHGIGVTGTQGRGLIDSDLFSVQEVPVLTGTLGKALGTAGAFVAGSEELIEYLIQRARNYVFSTAPPAAIAVATLESIVIVREEEWRREHLRMLIEKFRNGVESTGLQVLPSVTPIQPVLFSSVPAVLKASQILQDSGILVTAIRPPTVPADSPRLRITLTANHQEQDIDKLLGALGDVVQGKHDDT